MTFHNGALNCINLYLKNSWHYALTFRFTRPQDSYGVRISELLRMWGKTSYYKENMKELV